MKTPSFFIMTAVLAMPLMGAIVARAADGGAFGPANGAAQTAPAPQSKPGLFDAVHQTFGAGYLMFGGDTETSLTTTGKGKGYSMEISSFRGNEFFAVLSRIRFLYATGTSHLPDATGVARDIGFKLMAGESILGLRVNLLPASMSKVQPYMGIGGKLSMNQLSCPSAEVGSTPLASTVGLQFGTETFMGVELGTLGFVEVQVRSAKGKLGGIAGLSVEGMGMSVGLKW